MTFDTYHWQCVPLRDAELENARAELASLGDNQVHAFLRLLRSGSTAAVGSALDHYDYAEMSSRHGAGNPFHPHAGEVLEKARDLLRQPPLPADGSSVDEDGANHASALGAMLNLAEERDAELVAAALLGATGPCVRKAAIMTATTVIERSAAPGPALVDALRAVVDDDGLPGRERAEALDALGGSNSAATTDVLLRAGDSEDLDVQVGAAWNLAHLDLRQYRPLLERIVATWPADVPYPGSEVLDLLDGDGDGV
jgi:hypothetical protein